MDQKDLGANCLSFLQVTDPTGNFSSVEFFRSVFQVIDIHFHENNMILTI